MNLNIGLWNFILVMVHHKTPRIFCCKWEKKKLVRRVSLAWGGRNKIQYNSKPRNRWSLSASSFPLVSGERRGYSSHIASLVLGMRTAATRFCLPVFQGRGESEGTLGRRLLLGQCCKGPLHSTAQAHFWWRHLRTLARIENLGAEKNWKTKDVYLVGCQ